MTPAEPLWTIAELSQRVSAALAESDVEPPANRQVRAVPDLRTIRYYTSLGLLDRPSAMRARTALYGRRHLLQLVAIKRLQAAGQSLTQVQAALTGLDDRSLAGIARLPRAAAEIRTEPGGDAATSATAPLPGRRERFWAEPPAPLAEPAAGPAARAGLTRMIKIELVRGVSLIIEDAAGDGARSKIDPVDLVRAAAPLVEAMRRQGLVREAEEEESE